MEGWKLTEGIHAKRSLSEEEIWSKFNHIFSTKSFNATSYKFCFIKALIENVFNVDNDGYLDYDDIYEKFTETYWYLTVQHKIRQGNASIYRDGKKTSVERVFDKFFLRYPALTPDISFEAIDEKIRHKMVTEIKNRCKRYVIGAVYGDTDGTFYSFHLSKEILKFHPDVLAFLKKYEYILLKLNHYEWIKFLEKVNKEEDSYALAKKLDYATKRTNLKVYRNLLYDTFHRHDCFYCGRKLKSIEVDHFIPWSFVRNDKLWNLALACPKCNNSKRDSLSTRYYIEKILAQNDYIIEHSNNIDVVKREFKIYEPKKIYEMYECAIFNGFDYGWSPNATA